MAVLSRRGARLRLPELLEFLDARGVRGRALSFDGLLGARRGAVHRGAAAGRARAGGAASAIWRRASARRVALQEDVGTVTCVGAGLNADWGHLRRALRRGRGAGRAGARGAHLAAAALAAGGQGAPEAAHAAAARGVRARVGDRGT